MLAARRIGSAHRPGHEFADFHHHERRPCYSYGMRRGGLIAVAVTTLGLLMGCSGSDDPAETTSTGSGTSASAQPSSTTESTPPATTTTTTTSSSATDTPASPTTSSRDTSTGPTGTKGPTTYPGPKGTTAGTPEDCEFATPLGTTRGKIMLRVTCKEAQKVWRRYMALPAQPGAGSANHREFDGWQCYALTAGEAARRDEGGTCRRSVHGQIFVLHHQD